MNRKFLDIAGKPAIFLSALALTAMLMAVPVFAAERVLAGQYEITTVEADGKTRTGTNCITAEQAAGVNGDAKVGRAYMEKAAKGACKVTAYDIVGDTVSTEMVCGGGTTVVGRVTFHGNDASESHTTITRGGKTVLDAHLKSKRVGACK